jgi:hypothetical protein
VILVARFESEEAATANGKRKPDGYPVIAVQNTLTLWLRYRDAVARACRLAKPD